MIASPADLVIYPALVLTLEPGEAPIPNGFVAISKGRIAAVGQACDRAELPLAKDHVDVGGALVLPGLVNTHCHAPMVWFRGLADDLPLQDWLHHKIFPAERGWLDREKVYWGALLAAAEMIRGGITTVADGYFYEAEVRRAFQDAGLRAVVAQGLVDFPFPGVPDPKDNLAHAAHFLESQPEGSELITSALFCHTPYTCGPETLKGAKALTRDRGVPWFIHLAETRLEVEELKAQTGMSPAAYLDSLGLLDELTVVVHGVWLEPADREILARRGVKVSHCPESNLKLAAGVAPIPELLVRGVPVGLGTDGAASNNNLDLFGEMSLTARLHKVWQGDPTVLPAPEVLALATREGARVLGLEDRVGTLSPGKQADLIVVDVNQAHLTPLYDPCSHLIYAARSADVRHVMVGGRWLLKDRRLLTLDWPDLSSRARDYARDLSAFMAATRS
ncbi:MAG: amidohydrolase [Thermodesulfobacteriota bacterium]